MDKQFIKKTDWLRSDINNNWDRLNEHVIINSTYEDVPIEILNYVSNFHAQFEKNVITSINHENKQYNAWSIKLIDASWKEVGDIFVIDDVSQYINNVSKWLKNFIISSIIILIILMAFLNLIFDT